MQSKTLTLQQRLENRIMPEPNTGCWLWTGYVNMDGYGRITVNRKQKSVHRVSFEIFCGDPGELLVCHSCDEPSCVNPHHLFLGTVLDNINDMVKKGRVSRGSKHFCAVLNEEDVVKIRLMLSEKFTFSQIAKKFNCSRSAIGGIAANKYWRHVKS